MVAKIATIIVNIIIGTSFLFDVAFLLRPVPVLVHHLLAHLLYFVPSQYEDLRARGDRLKYWRGIIIWLRMPLIL
jgi:hypothetical protein